MTGSEISRWLALGGVSLVFTATLHSEATTVIAGPGKDYVTRGLEVSRVTGTS